MKNLRKFFCLILLLALVAKVGHPSDTVTPDAIPGTEKIDLNY